MFSEILALAGSEERLYLVLENVIGITHSAETFSHLVHERETYLSLYQLGHAIPILLVEVVDGMADLMIDGVSITFLRGDHIEVAVVVHGIPDRFQETLFSGSQLCAVPLVESLEGCAGHIEAIHGFEVTEFTGIFSECLDEVIDRERLLPDVGMCALIVFFYPEESQCHVFLGRELEVQQPVIDLV